MATLDMTVDADLMIAHPPAEGMETLKQWLSEGKVQITEALRPPVAAKSTGWPGAPSIAEQKGGRMARARKVDQSGKLKFSNVAAILFPSRNANKLSISEVNDVAHLIKHHGSERSLFVTTNSDTFINGGRRESLKAAFGIVTVTPLELVAKLCDENGWKAKEPMSA